ncbi:hypothetical protein PR048_002493 [Dryococelus australis]|uniref:Uncharacterized protein n=1 Tax=Dryococelus australis TaxID=614101 RepID=A0ABQ9IKG7_9NEOP|nr:hypothetical protein PR048_002493 [Dryococelus australis]
MSTAEVKEEMKAIIKNRLVYATGRSRHAKKSKLSALQPGQLVLVRAANMNKYCVRLTSKLMPLFAGPYEVKRALHANCHELVQATTVELVDRFTLPMLHLYSAVLTPEC